MNRLTKLLEGALFATSRPLSADELRRLEPGTSVDEVRAAVRELATRYDEADHGVELTELAEGYQILTRPELADAIAQAHIVDRPRRLSPAALETLAIVAYRQPVGRVEIEEIRGVVSDGVLRLLVERGLVGVAGRSDGLGRPLLYGTTPKFLEMLGLKSTDELPKLDELSVALTPLAPLREAEVGEIEEG